MKVVKVLIWLGFIALLAVSMPKIAWVFRSYEGVEAVNVQLWSITIDTLWLIPLFVALCIDALILALTYALSIDKAKTSQFGMWAFVALLCALSYYCNLLYNYAHAPIGSVWTDTLVNLVTPFIVSGVPLFALCYTLILSRIEGKGETLQEKATRLENEKVAKARIREATKGRFIRVIGDTLQQTISETKAVVNHMRTPGQVQAESENITEQEATHNTPVNASETIQESQERDTDKLARLNEQGTTEKDEQNASKSNGLNAPGASEIIGSSLSTGQKTVTIKEAALLLNMSESYTRTLVNNGKLRKSPRNNKLILKSSIDAYNAARKDTGKTPIMVIPNEQVNTEHNGTITLGFVEQKMYDALMNNPDNIPELLLLSQEQSLDDFTDTLKTRYSEYASYITPERVTNVIAYARLHNAELVELTA